MTDPSSYERVVAALRQARSGIDTALVHATALENERRQLVAADKWPDPNEGAGLIVTVESGDDLVAAMESVTATPLPEGAVVFHVSGHVPAVTLDRPWAPALFRGRIVRIVGKSQTTVHADPTGASFRMERGMGDIDGYQLELWSLRLRGDLRRVKGIGKGSVRWMDTITQSREVEPVGL